MKLFANNAFKDMLQPGFWDVPKAIDETNGEAIIGGDKKQPLLDAIKDPLAYAMSELNIALNDMNPNADNSTPQDSPSDAMQQHREFGEFMTP